MNIDEVLSTTARAWMRPMAPEDYASFLNMLLEAERAGAKLLAAYLDELPLHSSRWKSIRAIQLDEARNCAVLIHLLLSVEATPSTRVGDFYGKGLAIRGWRERMEFLNRGQAWVAKRLAAALTRVPEKDRMVLQAMYESHLANIDACEALL